jgi:hypothetical protein
MKTYLGFDEFASAVKSVSDYKSLDLPLLENWCVICDSILLERLFVVCSVSYLQYGTRS